MLLSYGNKKLDKSVGIWSLKAGIIGACERDCEDCYCLKVEKLRPVVMRKRMANYIVAKSGWFGALMLPELEKAQKMGIDTIRVHEGGDFFSQHYVDVWVCMAKIYSGMTFYAYTKMMGKFDFSKLMELENFILMDSLKPRKGLPNFAKEEVLRRGHHVMCTLKKGEKCGKHCRYCMTKEAQETPPCFVTHEKKCAYICTHI